MIISFPAEGEATPSLPEVKGIKILPNELSALPQMDTCPQGFQFQLQQDQLKYRNNEYN
jgi:hypothetical protein